MSKSIVERVLAGFDDPNAREDGITDFVNELKTTHPPAAAGLLARTMPTPSADAELLANYVPPDVNVITIPEGHSFGPDEKLRPWDESEALWAKVRQPPPAIVDDSDAETSDADVVEREEYQGPQLVVPAETSYERLRRECREQGWEPLPPRVRK